MVWTVTVSLISTLYTAPLTDCMPQLTPTPSRGAVATEQQSMRPRPTATTSQLMPVSIISETRSSSTFSSRPAAKTEATVSEPASLSAAGSR